MAELVDALDSGSSRGNSVDVRVILAAHLTKKNKDLSFGLSSSSSGSEAKISEKPDETCFYSEIACQFRSILQFY